MAPPQAARPAQPVTDPARLLAGVVNHWLGALRVPFPRDYMVLDIETTGPDAGADLILSIGHVIVEGGVVTDRLDAYLDWTTHPGVNQQWLYDRMARTREQMAARGRTYQMRYEDLAARGAAPVGVLTEYRELIRAQQAAGYAFVMHNGYNFDAPRLCSHFARWTDGTVEFGPNEIWDTGMLEKAGQLNHVPDPGESIRAWSKRVGGVRAKGVNWALDMHCVPKYGLATRFHLDVAQAHGAGFDAYVTHLLFETFRELAEAHRGETYCDPLPRQSLPGFAGDADPGGRHGHLG